MKIIAHIRTDFDEKFGVPRQAGLVPECRGRIVFEPEYRDESAFRGLADFSHIWLIWQFSHVMRQKWSPTVRPPRLGGNKRMGVFATRSPYRPNPIGLSCVRLISVELHTDEGPQLIVGGADLVDGTPIYDIKPYITYADSVPDATGGFTEGKLPPEMPVHISDELRRLIPEDKQDALIGVLAQDPRPHYQDDPERVYGLSFAGMNVKFICRDGEITVEDITR